MAAESFSDYIARFSAENNERQGAGAEVSSGRKRFVAYHSLDTMQNLIQNAIDMQKDVYECGSDKARFDRKYRFDEKTGKYGITPRLATDRWSRGAIYDASKIIMDNAELYPNIVERSSDNKFGEEVHGKNAVSALKVLTGLHGEDKGNIIVPAIAYAETTYTDRVTKEERTAVNSNCLMMRQYMEENGFRPRYAKGEPQLDVDGEPCRDRDGNEIKYRYDIPYVAISKTGINGPYQENYNSLADYVKDDGTPVMFYDLQVVGKGGRTEAFRPEFHAPVELGKLNAVGKTQEDLSRRSLDEMMKELYAVGQKVSMETGWKIIPSRDVFVQGRGRSSFVHVDVENKTVSIPPYATEKDQAYAVDYMTFARSLSYACAAAKAWDATQKEIDAHNLERASGRETYKEWSIDSDFSKQRAYLRLSGFDFDLRNHFGLGRQAVLDPEQQAERTEVLLGIAQRFGSYTRDPMIGNVMFKRDESYAASLRASRQLAYVNEGAEMAHRTYDERYNEYMMEHDRQKSLGVEMATGKSANVEKVISEALGSEFSKTTSKKEKPVQKKTRTMRAVKSKAKSAENDGLGEGR